MVPLELQLKNFLSYGDETTHLDLTNLHTVCLSGENGHGKSALLDAITWALWGETRLGKQGHEQLIRIGADEMSVIFTFRLGTGRFRVRRQRSRKTSGQIWELQQDDGGGRWRPLTGVSSSDTGKTIQNLLRMSYDTFLNSAYLRQGRADEFVRQTANKRKEILCEILDLGRYDTLEERARLKSREAGTLAAEAQQRLNVIESSIAQEPGYRLQLEDCVKRSAVIEAEHATLTAEFERLSSERNLLDAQRKRLEQIDRELATLTSELRKLDTAVAAERDEIRKAQALVDKREVIIADYDKLVRTREERDRLQQQVAVVYGLEKQRLVVQNEIETLRRQLRHEIDDVERELAAIAKSDSDVARLTSDLSSLRTQLGELDEAEKRRNHLIDVLIPEARERFSKLRSDREQIDASLAALNLRLVNLDAQTERCSICGNILPPEKIVELKHECQAECERLACSKREVNATGVALKKQLDVLSAEREALDRQLAGANALRENRAKFEQELLTLETRRALKPELDSELAKLKEAYADRSYAADKIAMLAQLDSDLSAHSGVQRALDEAGAIVKSLADAERRFHAVTHAETTLAGANARLETHLERVSALQMRKQEVETDRLALSDIAEKVQRVEQELTNTRAHSDQNAADAARAHTDRGRIEAYLQGIENHRRDKVDRQKERDAQLRDEEIYKQLAVAFSKQGIQAIIIENALPELEEDANQILDRISDGALSIKVLTTRKAKARPTDAGVIETLDINISDHLGARPLELYSGGESFRVSFALRIALSKLLARRAGANLQTLIIDEGFGTQDGKGREKLVEAITAISDDFEKIIVITHVDELKDAFPARIDVVKTPLGSQLTVTEGGYIG